MQPKLLKASSLAEYVPAAWGGKNESGYEPVDEIVLILPDTSSDMTSGGIHLTPGLIERQSLSAETGVIVAMADGAFRWNRDRSRPMQGYRPQPGDRVYMRRFAGQVMLGEDGKLYRACSDVEIAAVKRGSHGIDGSMTVGDALGAFTPNTVRAKIDQILGNTKEPA